MEMLQHGCRAARKGCCESRGRPVRSRRGLDAAIAAVARAVAQAVVAAGELQKFRLEQGASRSNRGGSMSKQGGPAGP
eukprot:5162216-Prymnesium_polylepis.1